MSKHKPAKADSRRAQLRAAQIAEAKRAKNRRIAIIAVSAVVALVLVVAGGMLIKRLSDAKAASAPPMANSDQSGIKVFPDAQVKQGAPLVSLYADYQCPACASFEKAFGKQLEDMGRNGEIQLDYRTMTFLDAMVRNDASVRAANAAVCTTTTGRYAQYHATVFANQPQHEGDGYTDAQLTQAFTQQAGITGENLEKFNSCYQEKKYNDFVNGVNEKAGKDGVTGTPTLTVNGKKLEMKNLNTTDPDSLRSEIFKLK